MLAIFRTTTQSIWPNILYIKYIWHIVTLAICFQNHNPEYLTDVEEEDDDATHWQSVTMDDEMQNLASTSVNLTMSLGKDWWGKFNDTSNGHFEIRLVAPTEHHQIWIILKMSSSQANPSTSPTSVWSSVLQGRRRLQSTRRTGETHGGQTPTLRRTGSLGSTTRPIARTRS